MPRASRVLATPPRLSPRTAAVIEERLDDFESRSSFDADEMEALWSDVLPEGMPERRPDGRVVLTARVQEALELILRDCRRRKDNSVSPDEWVILCRTVLPEVFHDPPRAAAPTPALPGTEEKLRVLEARAARGLCLWHALDPCDLARPGSCEYAVCPALRRTAARAARARSKAREEDARRGQLRLFGCLESPKPEYNAAQRRPSGRAPARSHAT